MSQIRIADPIYIEWFRDEATGEKISIAVLNETKIVAGGKIILDYIPDKFFKVIFSATPTNEIGINEKITDINQYKVDYGLGVVYLHSSRETEELTYNYYKRGIIYYPASRVYTSNDGDVVTSIQDILDNGDEILQAIETLSPLIDDINSNTVNRHSPTVLGTKSIDETGLSDGRVIKYNSTSGNLEYGDVDIVSAVDSVNSKTGDVILNQDDVGDGITYVRTTNDYTDAEKTKLSNIETNADVTDAVNVNSAGAVMNTDTTTADMNFVIDEDNMASNLATKVPTQQSVKAYVDSSISASGGGDMLKTTYDPNSVEGNVFDVDNHIDGTTNKVFSATEKTKLSNIEDGAEVNVVNSVSGKTGTVSLVKSDVGLGSVDNYATASQVEAEAGTVTNKFMTPERVKQAISALVGYDLQKDGADGVGIINFKTV